MSSRINSSSPPVPHHHGHLNCCKQCISIASENQSYTNGTKQNVFPRPLYFCVYTINSHIGKPNKNWGQMRNSALELCILCLCQKTTQVYLLSNEAGSIKTILLYTWLCVKLFHTKKDAWNYMQKDVGKKILSCKLKKNQRQEGC